MPRECQSPAWAWTSVVLRMTSARVPPVARAALAAVAFCFCVHTFFVAAFHTTDGLFFASLGTALLLRGGGAGVAGAVLLGCAPLCKQNFLAMIPAALVLAGHARSLRLWAAAFAPLAAYTAWIASCGGLSDFASQLSAQTGLVQQGVVTYVFQAGFPWGIAAGAALALLPRAAPWIAAGAAVGAAASMGLQTRVHFTREPSFLLAGMTLGAVAARFLRAWTSGGFRSAASDRTTLCGALVFSLAWTVSVSVGWNSPGFGTGACAVWLLVVACAGSGRSTLIAACAAGVAALAAFHPARTRKIYRDRPAAELTVPLDGILPGAAGIRTNPETAAMLAELRDTAARTEGPVTVLPDLAAFWIRSERRNPLPIDWPFGFELGSPAVRARYREALDRSRGTVTVLLTKYRTEDLAWTRRPVPSSREDWWPIPPWIRSGWTKTGEGAFFETWR
ncbi:MAG: hypothetical protein HMLKMBBP_02576 [Planctomycetes bacterium]|nr:hypothetical protein [Planctomycetota bacterium]